MFTNFIASSKLMDLQLLGRKFTWYKPDGTCKSRLDRIMVNKEWMWKWPDLSLRSLGRTFSDHCPLVIKHVIVEWGHKPFKYFNGWSSHQEFKDFYKNKWAGYDIQEKLKRLKRDLKWWRKTSFGALNSKIEANKEIVEKPDRFDEVFGLEEEEIIERNRN
ncbi:hypothetical protein ACS0TY_008607 [Phlomoides rotata]